MRLTSARNAWFTIKLK